MNREWWRQERRYQRARKRAERLLAIVKRLNQKCDRLVGVMQDAYDKQKACEEAIDAAGGEQ